MPIVDPEIIKSGENELFSSILASFDKFQIEKLFQDSHDLLLKGQMQFKEGKMVVHNNQIAYQLYFTSVAVFSVLIDEFGRFMGFTNFIDIHPPDADKAESNEKILDYELLTMRKAEFLDALSASINIQTINKLLYKIYNVWATGKTIFKQGNIKVFNDHVSYQCVYETNAVFSILIDRAGNHINTSIDNNEITMPRGNQLKNNQKKLEYAIPR